MECLKSERLYCVVASPFPFGVWTKGKNLPDCHLSFSLKVLMMFVLKVHYRTINFKR